MKTAILKYLVCPICGSNLVSEASGPGQTQIQSGFLSCGKGHRFSVTNGIPRLLKEEQLSATQADVKSSFNEKWLRIPNYGHDDNTRDFQLKWYLQRYGWGTKEKLAEFLASRHFILDAGTGTGRDTKLYAENTKGEVFGIDITTSVDAAQSHLTALKNAALIQTDLTRLPFPNNFFDFIASDQVLHHTQNTEKSFKYLVEHLAPGGQIAIYVYKKKGPIREFCDDYIRNHTTKLSAKECYEFSESITKLGKSLSDQKTEIDVPEDIPLLGISAGKQNLQRFIYWNVFKCFWNDDFDFETNVMINFDWYHPFYAYRHTPEEVKQWFKDIGLKMLHFDVNESGISARGLKPAS
jgi:ubiquinone/menaquinone biosynthesis C-methylase UbiE/uncharacterized protein YbaR (Trm112 family)